MDVFDIFTSNLTLHYAPDQDFVNIYIALIISQSLIRAGVNDKRARAYHSLAGRYLSYILQQHTVTFTDTSAGPILKWPTSVGTCRWSASAIIPILAFGCAFSAFRLSPGLFFSIDNRLSVLPMFATNIMLSRHFHP